MRDGLPAWTRSGWSWRLTSTESRVTASQITESSSSATSIEPAT